MAERWRKRFEIALLSGPAVIMFVGFVIFPVCLAAYYGFFRWKGYGKPTDFVGLKNYKVILTDPEFHAALSHNLFIVVASLVIQGPIAIGLALLLNRAMRGRSLIRVLIFVPYVISEVIVGTGLEPHAPDERRRQRPAQQGRARLAGQRVALEPGHRDLDLDGHHLVEVHRVRGDPVHGRAAEHPGGAVRGGLDRRRELLADPAAASRCRCSARRCAYGRSCPIIGSLQLFDLVYIIWGQYVAGTAGVSTMATYMVQYGRSAGNFGYGSAVAVVLFVISLVHRARLPALRPAPGHGRRPHG